MTMTDYVVLVFLLYHFYRGWRKGLLRSLLGPGLLVICSYAGVQYFKNTQNIKLALGIAVLGPIIMNILLSGIIALWRKAVNKDGKISVADRLLGSAFSIVWGCCLLIITFLSVIIIPKGFSKIDAARQDILNSRTFALVIEPVKNKLPSWIPIDKPLDIQEGSPMLDELGRSEAYQALVEDEKMQEILSDEEIVEQMRNREVVKLLDNPKIQAIFQDKDLIMKFMEVNKKMLEANASQENQ